MALVFLLALAGLAAANEPPRREAREAATGTVPADGVGQARGETAPLRLGSALLKSPLQLVPGLRWEPGDARDAGDRAPRRVPPPRVVCAMPVLKVDPSFDPGFVLRLPAGPPDPIVRDDLSRCVE